MSQRQVRERIAVVNLITAALLALSILIEGMLAPDIMALRLAGIAGCLLAAFLFTVANRIFD